MNIKASYHMPKITELMKECELNEEGKVQKYIDNFILFKSEPYLPGRHIHAAGIANTKIGKGEVVWDSPDARFLYEGKLMVDPETLSPYARKGVQKIMDPENRDLEYHGGRLRGKEWFDRMINSEQDELIKGCQKIIDGG